MKILRIGIAPYEEMKARTMAIARGELKPGPDEPKLWFTSIESLARVLSDKNRVLLDLIIAQQPKSLAELEALSGRAKSNLSRTLNKYLSQPLSPPSSIPSTAPAARFA